MKKILLASTALVSLAVANQAFAMAENSELKLNGDYRFGFASISDNYKPAVQPGLATDPEGAEAKSGDDTIYTDSEIKVTYDAVADNGLNFGMVVEMQADEGDDGVDESSLYLKDDFGTITLGNNDGASDTFGPSVPTHHGALSDGFGENGIDGDVTNFKTQTRFTAAGVAEAPSTAAADRDGNVTVSTAARYRANVHDGTAGDAPKIIYVSPNFSGFQFGASWGDGGKTKDTGQAPDTSMGAKFNSPDIGFGIGLTLAGATVTNGEEDQHERSSTGYGASFDWDALTFAFRTASVSTGNTPLMGATNCNADGVNPGRGGTTQCLASALKGDDVGTTEFALGYTVHSQLDFALSQSSSEDETSKDSAEALSFSAGYTLVPGLVATLAYSTFANEPGSVTLANEYAAGATAESIGNEGSLLVGSIAASF
jgi:hypothetical protein